MGLRSNIKVQPDISVQSSRTASGRRPLRLAALVAAAYLFLEPTAGAVTGPTSESGASLYRAVATAAAPVPDTGCGTATPPPGTVSRAAARGTLPNTGGESPGTLLAAAAGLLISGLLLRVASRRLRRGETR